MTPRRRTGRNILGQGSQASTTGLVQSVERIKAGTSGRRSSGSKNDTVYASSKWVYGTPTGRYVDSTGLRVPGAGLDINDSFVDHQMAVGIDPIAADEPFELTAPIDGIYSVKGFQHFYGSGTAVGFGAGTATGNVRIGFQCAAYPLATVTGPDFTGVTGNVVAQGGAAQAVRYDASSPDEIFLQANATQDVWLHAGATVSWIADREAYGFAFDSGGFSIVASSMSLTLVAPWPRFYTIGGGE